MEIDQYAKELAHNMLKSTFDIDVLEEADIWMSNKGKKDTWITVIAVAVFVEDSE
tara:strand:- start:162 stop:326 length:165 start_codon:yes stop_codon:yes gene_type:complete